MVKNDLTFIKISFGRVILTFNFTLFIKSRKRNKHFRKKKIKPHYLCNTIFEQISDLNWA